MGSRRMDGASPLYLASLPNRPLNVTAPRLADTTELAKLLNLARSREHNGYPSDMLISQDRVDLPASTELPRKLEIL